MTPKTQLCTGIVGTALAALCCFTSVLVVGLGAVGLSSWLGWTDLVLLPVLGFFLIVTVLGARRLWKQPS